LSFIRFFGIRRKYNTLTKNICIKLKHTYAFYKTSIFNISVEYFQRRSLHYQDKFRYITFPWLHNCSFIHNISIFSLMRFIYFILHLVSFSSIKFNGSFFMFSFYYVNLNDLFWLWNSVEKFIKNAFTWLFMECNLQLN
jgi:hypothetical protein